MKNPESASVVPEMLKRRGRERVPTAAALDAQKKLVIHMTPERLKQYIDPSNDYDPFMEALMLRYMDKYDSGDYNGFAEYCNEHEDDSAFMGRVINQGLTAEDFEDMTKYLLSHGGQPQFFVDEVEVEGFIKSITH